jgi:coxsackievirus/adenovirus receptor
MLTRIRALSIKKKISLPFAPAPANYVPVTPTQEFRACLSSPCHTTSTCIDLPSATFVCACRPNYTGLLCDEEINKRDYEVPSFDGKSYVRMNRLKAYHKFSIEVEFKTYADNGLILYNQQKSDGTGDFVSLAIVDGLVFFVAFNRDISCIVSRKYDCSR